MPHDSKGRLVEEGDLIIAKHWLHGNRPSACLVLGVNAAADTCNLTVVSVAAPQQQTTSVTAKESELLLKRNGDKPAAELEVKDPESKPA